MATLINERVLWICGRYLTDKEWEFQGLFSSEEGSVLAAADCDAPCFVAPVVLDQQIAEASSSWPGAYYPHQGK